MRYLFLKEDGGFEKCGFEKCTENNFSHLIVEN